MSEWKDSADLLNNKEVLCLPKDQSPFVKESNTYKLYIQIAYSKLNFKHEADYLWNLFDSMFVCLNETLQFFCVVIKDRKSFSNVERRMIVPKQMQKLL